MEFEGLQLEKYRLTGDNIDDIEICIEGIWLKKDIIENTEETKHKFFYFTPIDPTLSGAKKYINQIVKLPIEAVKFLYKLRDVSNYYKDLVNEGMILASHGEIKKAINFEPQVEEAYINLGNAYDDLEDYENAILTFEKALEINPNNPDNYFNLGVIYNNYRKYISKNIFRPEFPINHFSNLEENSTACFLMATYLGDEKALKTTQDRQIDCSSKEKIIEKLLSLAEERREWGFYKSAKRIFNYVLFIDKTNKSAEEGILFCEFD
jgi:tetratricopeptide (TPR) repeat protein